MFMQFIRAEGTKEITSAMTAALTQALGRCSNVLWLVPGGSNITVAVEVMNNLRNEPLEKLTIMLTDERYGEPGHEDSNYAQLERAGFLPGAATFKNMLTGESFETTVKSAALYAREACTVADEIIGFFGMGVDGHIAGILPHSAAATTDSAWVVGYESQPYVRITLTPFALSHIAQAFVGAYGKEKYDPLLQLKNTVLPIAEQPAQILRHIPEVYIYSNQIGDE